MLQTMNLHSTPIAIADSVNEIISAIVVGVGGVDEIVVIGIA